MINVKSLVLNLDHIQKISSLENCKNIDLFQLNGINITDVEKLPSVASTLNLNIPSIQKIEFTESNQLSAFEFLGNSSFSLDFCEIANSYPNLIKLIVRFCGNEEVSILNNHLEKLIIQNFLKVTTLTSSNTQHLNILKLLNLPKLDSLDSFHFSKKTTLNYLVLDSLGIYNFPSFKNVIINHFECIECLNISLNDQSETLINVAPKSFVFPKLIQLDDDYERDVYQFFIALTNTKLFLEDKKRFFNLYAPIFNLTDHQNFQHTKTDLLKLSTILYIPLQQRILQNISEIVEKYLRKFPINSTIKLSILGEIGTNKKDFIERLIKSRITYHSRIEQDTSHVIIGKSIKNFNYSEDLVWVSENLITDYLNTQGQIPYLLENSKEENKQNVLQLLLSEEENTLIALNILSTGGVPKELLTALLFVQKTAENKKIREKVKNLLLANGSLVYQQILLEDLKLKNYIIYQDEIVFYDFFMKLSEQYPTIDWGQFTLFFYQKYKKGLRFFFKKTTKENLERQTIFEELIENNCLDLFKVFIKEIPSYHDFYTDPISVIKECEIPIEVFEQTDLIELSLKGFALKEIPKEISQLINLTKLDLSYNLFEKLPEELMKLKKLETLIISCNEFEEFPIMIGELKNLKSLEIKGNREKYDDNFIKEIPNIIKIQLPNCTFLHN